MAKITVSSVGTPYIVVVRDGQWWNQSTSAFEDFATANWSHYAIEATQYGSSDAWFVTFPNVGAGTVDLIQFLQAGGSPAETDSGDTLTHLYWDGIGFTGMQHAKLE